MGVKLHYLNVWIPAFEGTTYCHVYMTPISVIAAIGWAQIRPFEDDMVILSLSLGKIEIKSFEYQLYERPHQLQV